MARLLSVLGLGSLGCMAMPSPLAPGLGGAVGFPHSGAQTEAAELPVRGEGFVRFRPHSRNYWGRPRLVRALERAAARVSRELPGGAPLVVGDLSARRGGKIPGHNSHRTGRDVDLLYYVTTPAGVPLESPGFVAFEADGLALLPGEEPTYLRLDVPRQWAFVKELLRDGEIGVQFLFASRDVETLLVDYALARGESIELVYRAQTVLIEPADSTPHADHAHLRIACTPDEALRGCSGGGPYWEWLPELAPPPAVDAALLEALALDEPAILDGARDARPPAADELGRNAAGARHDEERRPARTPSPDGA